MKSEIICIKFYSIFIKEHLYTDGGGGGGADCHVKHSSANSSKDTEHRTWCTGPLLFTQYGGEVLHHTNLEHYRTLTSKIKSCQGKNAN